MNRELKLKIYEKVRVLFCEDEDRIEEITEEGDCYVVKGERHYEYVKVRLDKKTLKILNKDLLEEIGEE